MLNRTFKFIRENLAAVCFGLTYSLTIACTTLFGYDAGGTLIFYGLAAASAGWLLSSRFYKQTIDRLMRNLAWSDKFVDKINISLHTSISNQHRYYTEVTRLRMANDKLLREIELLRNPEEEEAAIEAEIRRINS